MRTQTFYEQAGILLPGVLVVFGLLLFVPEVGVALSVGDFTIGDFGLFVLVAYASGYVIASVATLMEQVFWTGLGGPPSDLPTRKQQLLTRRETEMLAVLTSERFGQEGEEVRVIAGEHWQPLYERIHRSVIEKNHPGLAILGGEYALSRGLAAAFLLLTIIVVFFAPTYMRGWAWGTVSLGALNLYRMYRSGIAYAKEVLRAFLASRGAPYPEMTRTDELTPGRNR